MPSSLTRNETLLLAACVLLAALALFGPAIAQPPHLHDFADQRSLWGVPHALDVLSNLPFALAGAWGLWLLRAGPAGWEHAAQRACARLFFLGLLVTAAGSSWYHLAPDDVGLAIDRASMSVAFAGLLGVAAAGRISDRAGRVLAGSLLVLAPASVFFWLVTDNVLPWAVVQFGGMLLVLMVLGFGSARAATWPVRWSLVLLAYALAKLLETHDEAILHASGELFSGHTLKHVAAAASAWPLVAVLSRRQNGRHVAAQAA